MMGGSEVGDTVWQTRTHMTFLVSNIQSYVLSDVLETQKAKAGCTQQYQDKV